MLCELNDYLTVVEASQDIEYSLQNEGNQHAEGVEGKVFNCSRISFKTKNSSLAVVGNECSAETTA